MQCEHKKNADLKKRSSLVVVGKKNEAVPFDESWQGVELRFSGVFIQQATRP
jgi:hypothetical protein